MHISLLRVKYFFQLYFQEKGKQMAIKVKAAILLCLVSAAAYSVCGAYKSIQSAQAFTLPEELSAQLESTSGAEFFLRESEGYVAIFESKKGRTPLSVTGIETAKLRSTDRLLLNRGIPVMNSSELLLLLEDLGS